MFCARISKNKSNRVSSDNTQPKKVSFYAYYPPTSHLVLQSKELPDNPNPVKRRSVGYSNQCLARAGQNITASSIPNSGFR